MEILRLFPQTLKRTGACLLALALAAAPAQAADDARYHKVEAAFLYNFFNYITWPGYIAPQDLHEAKICIFQNDPIEPYLSYVQQKMSAERHLSVQVISEDADSFDCNLIFMRHHLAAETAHRIAPSTLIVTEPQDSLDRGEGMIELSRMGQGIQMKINQQALTDSGFQVSSRLLDLAMK